jgi:hypothetical protein
MKTLAKIYVRANEVEDPELDTYRYSIPESVSCADLEHLDALGLLPNAFRTVGHDQAVDRMRATVQAVTVPALANAFLAAISGQWPRGLQPLASFARMRHLPRHEFQPYSRSEDYLCEVCGGSPSMTDDVTRIRWRLADGCGITTGAHSLPLFLLDLEDFSEGAAGAPRGGSAGRATLEHILEIAASTAPATTPGQLAKQLEKSKVVPRSNKWRRREILHVLASTGVLPNGLRDPPLVSWISVRDEEEFSSQARRSVHTEIDWPLAAWRGENGVDWGIAESIFGSLE